MVSVLVASYFSVNSFTASASPKATWATNPITIMVAATAGPGFASATDYVTCTPTVTGLTLIAKASTSRISLATSPINIGTCGSTVSTTVAVRLTAACLVSPALCKGTYSGLVQIRQASTYRDIPDNLQVTIIVN